jgi:hypothetical protein
MRLDALDSNQNCITGFNKKEILNNQQAQADGLCLLKILHVIVMVSLQTACFKQVQQVRR